MKDTPCLANRFTALEDCNDKVAKNMMSTSPIPTITIPQPLDVSESPIDNQRILLRSASLRRCTELQLHIESVSSHHPMGVAALLDSGATGLFIDAEFVKAKNLTTQKLPRAIQVFNIDGTLNEHGAVKETVDLVIRYQDHTERATFYVTMLGGVPLILGHPWLVEHNPEIVRNRNIWSGNSVGKVTDKRSQIMRVTKGG